MSGTSSVVPQIIFGQIPYCCHEGEGEDFDRKDVLSVQSDLLINYS